MDNITKEFESILQHTKEELRGLRTNRASTALIENLLIEAYGTKTPLQQLASISVPEPRQIALEPWDRTIVKDIEKSLSASNLGVSIKNEGTLLRVSFPPLTEESRKHIVKLLNQKLEQGKITLRAHRDAARDVIMNLHKESSISEDEKYRRLEQLDKHTKDYTEKINESGKKKEEEIMTV